MAPKRNTQKDDSGDMEETEMNREIESLRENLQITSDENLKVKSAVSELERENRRLDSMLEDTRTEADKEIQAMRRRLHEQGEDMQRDHERALQELRETRAQPALQEERHVRTPEQQLFGSDPWASPLNRQSAQSPVSARIRHGPSNPDGGQTTHMPDVQHGRYQVPLPRQMLYDGKESYEAFIRPFIDMGKVCKWGTEEKLFRLTNSLRGEAADFVFNQLDVNVRSSFYNLQHALSMRFKERRSSASFLAELENRKLGQKEKLVEYVTDVRYLVRNSYPTADAVTLDTIGLRHFLKGIGDQQMVLAVGMKNPQSIEEACEILEMYKSLKEEPFGKPSTGAVRMKVVKSANGEAEFLKRETFEVFKHEIKDSMDKKFSEITSMLKSRIGENQRYQAPNRTFKRRNMSTVECFKCHEIGHYASDCPTRQADGADGGVAKKQEN
ncbi:MAG: hypothetical protein ABW185_15950 [Sedimenticola sp.]